MASPTSSCIFQGTDNVLGSLYSSSKFLLFHISYSLSMFFFGPNIFLSIFLSKTYNFFLSDLVIYYSYLLLLKITLVEDIII